MINAKLGGVLLGLGVLGLGLNTPPGGEEELQEAQACVYFITVGELENNNLRKLWGGSATAIKCEALPDGTFKVYFLTAKHIVDDATEDHLIFMSVMTPIPGLASDKSFLDVQAKVEGINEKFDAAIVSAIFKEEHPVIALAEDMDIEAGQEVYSIGMGALKGPTITDGYISYDSGDSPNWVSTAPIIFGNSGGPIIRKSDMAVVGIVVQLLEMNANLARTPIYHINYFLPISRVLPWLKENGWLS